jgi:hypothetical protein
MKNPRHIPGWTLSETLVMMIVAGIVFVSVMEGVTLFNRYAGQKTRQIVDNMRLWDGYYHLRDLAATADSASMAPGSAISLFNRRATLAELRSTPDSMLVAQLGTHIDTLMTGVSGLRFSADTLTVTIRDTLTVSFAVVPPPEVIIVRSLSERETTYAYE